VGNRAITFGSKSVFVGFKNWAKDTMSPDFGKNIISSYGVSYVKVVNNFCGEVVNKRVWDYFRLYLF